MAIRIRKDGRMLCAALTSAESEDVYIDDGLHYELSAVKKLLVTTPMEVHEKTNGEWYWSNQVPEGVIISDFYFDKSDITRFEYIDKEGRSIVKKELMTYQWEDDGLTLKIFEL